MNLIFRLLCIVAGAVWRPKLGIMDASLVKFRVWPLDLDINLHLTNSRYLALMDLGRTDHILRSGTWKIMRRDRLGVVLGGVAMRFRRSIAPFEQFELETKILGWDERWIYVQQTFSGRNGVACVAVARAAFIKAGKAIPSRELLAKGGVPAVSPELPAWVPQWAEVEAAFAA